MADDQARVRFQQGAQHAGVRRAVAQRAHQGLDDAAAAHFVVILADDVFLGTDVQPPQHAPQKLALAPRVKPRAFHADVRHVRGFPHGFQLHLGHAVVHELHGQGGHHPVAVAGLEETGSGEMPQSRGLHIHARGQIHKGRQLVRRHGQGHALLRFGKQNLPGPQTVVFQRGPGDVQHAAARIFGHFTHRGGQAARAVVRNGVVQAKVARAQNKIVHLALGNGVADLHGRGR